MPRVLAAATATDSSAGVLVADDATIYIKQTAMSFSETKLSAKTTVVARILSGSHTRGPPLSGSHRVADGLERGEYYDRVDVDHRGLVESHGSKCFDTGRRGNIGFFGVLS